MIDFNLILQIGREILSPLVVGIVLWLIGDNAEKRKLKADAIRELMGYRGDYGSIEFGRALNKVSVIFNNNEEIRLDVRNLYERINTSPNSAMTKRAIVGLIYKLCQKNGFNGLTEYDIDQAFPENKQEPQAVPVEEKKAKVEKETINGESIKNESSKTEEKPRESGSRDDQSWPIKKLKGTLKKGNILRGSKRG